MSVAVAVVKNVYMVFIKSNYHLALFSFFSHFFFLFLFYSLQQVDRFNN